MTNTVLYDTIGERYRDSKRLPFSQHVERYTLVELLGDLRGQTVLDLACGDGGYARECKRSGAASVTGVDISKEMIAMAEAEERKDPLGCRYVCEDAATFTLPTQVDIVVAVYLLNYARTRTELDRFFRSSYRALRPGGRLVGFNNNMRRPPRAGVSMVKYGFERTCPDPPREGDIIRMRMTNPDGRSFEFANYYLRPGTYVASAREAGFDDFRWVDALLDPAEQGNPYWDDFLADAPVTAFTASRQPRT
ncbi:MAG: class I SAM-dependent methyltransferase [Acidobacteria bacterium]|nr:class I SAM-dependent methyltransferase [Acidobacteriota bacterium]MYH28319.1 class I SAM-dependent methyltransferase [Acidobacteriota bacterium]